MVIGVADQNPATALSPIGTEFGCPLLGIDATDGQPSLDRHWVRTLDQRLETIDRHGKTKVGLNGGLKRDDALHLAMHVEDGSATVARFDRHRELQHLAAVNLPPSGYHAAHDTVLEAQRIAHDNGTCAILELIGIT